MSRRTALGVLTLLLASCSRSQHETGQPDSSFGFRLVHELAAFEPAHPVEFRKCNYGSPQPPPPEGWVAGPHSDFGALEPTLLAVESLDWFRERDQAAETLETLPHLELVYPGVGYVVEARFDPSLDASWAEQLAAWFGSFPPSDQEAASSGSQHHWWSLSFGSVGRVRGRGGTAEDVFATLRAACPAPGSLLADQRPRASIGTAIRRAPRETDVYSVEVESLDLLDELPSRLRQKLEEYAWRYQPHERP